MGNDIAANRISCKPQKLQAMSATVKSSVALAEAQAGGPGDMAASPFKGLGAGTTQMGVAPSPIAEDFDVVEDIGPGQISGFVDPFADAFVFQAA